MKQNKKQDWNLSDKVVYYGSIRSGRVISEKDVKEFIKRLKYQLSCNLTLSKTPLNDSYKIIDKLAGERLK